MLGAQVHDRPDHLDGLLELFRLTTDPERAAPLADRIVELSQRAGDRPTQLRTYEEILGEAETRAWRFYFEIMS